MTELVPSEPDFDTFLITEASRQGESDRRRADYERASLELFHRLEAAGVPDLLCHPDEVERNRRTMDYAYKLYNSPQIYDDILSQLLPEDHAGYTAFMASRVMVQQTGDLAMIQAATQGKEVGGRLDIGVDASYSVKKALVARMLAGGLHTGDDPWIAFININESIPGEALDATKKSDRAYLVAAMQEMTQKEYEAEQERIMIEAAYEVVGIAEERSDTGIHKRMIVQQMAMHALVAAYRIKNNPDDQISSRAELDAAFDELSRAAAFTVNESAALRMFFIDKFGL